MTKIKKENFRHIIQEDKGNVVSILERDPYELSEELSTFCGLKYKVDSFRGVAKCVEGDEFNEKTGMYIADLKALIKYRHHRARRLELAAMEYEKQMNILQQAAMDEIEAMGKAEATLEKFLKSLEQ